MNSSKLLIKNKLILAAILMSSQTVSAAPAFNQTNLVTDNPAINQAQITDSKLVDAWGVSYLGNGAFWVSDNGTGVSTLYSVNPTSDATSKLGLTVAIPGNGSVTGQVANSNASAFGGDVFLFVSEDGTISGWKGGPAQTLQAASGTNSYKGVTEVTLPTSTPGVSDSYLYAANFGTDHIDVLKGSTTTPDLTGNFTDPNLPAGYSPFNIQYLNGELFVTYAQQQSPGSINEVDGLGKGFVDEFDTQGNFLGRVASQGNLDAPWGLAIAPSSFGAYAGDLLVGNFGSGIIDVFNLTSHSFIGELSDSNGNPIQIDGLWALILGNDGSAGSSQKLYFTAGPNGENDGLFGSIAAVPLPSAVWLFAAAMAGWRGFTRRKSPSSIA